MQRSDIRAVGDLAGEASSVLTALIRGMHAGIAGRVFDSIGPSATPTRTIHNGISRAIYTGVDRGLRGASRAAGMVAAESWGNEVDEALESRSDSVGATLAAVNGIYGDELTKHQNPLAGAMVVRRDGKSLALTTDALAAAYPAATGRVVVFVHGWCLTERSWSRPPRDAEDGRSYGERLHEDLGYSPVLLRYNTGLHISVNGRTLAGILDLLHDQWPVPITELVLVGHSMGGLVVRSACHYGTDQQHLWPDVSSTVTPTLLGVLAGDHLVRPKSAAGIGKSWHIPFAAEQGLTLAGLNHFDLLNHPLVYAKLRDWLAQSPVRAAGIGDAGRNVSGDG